MYVNDVSERQGTVLQRISIDDSDRITLVDRTPTGEPHLDATLDLVGTEGGLKVSKVLRKTRGRTVGLTIDSLVDLKVLTRRRALLGVQRYPARDGAEQVAIRHRLAQAVIERHTPDERTAALIGVLTAGKLWRRGVPGGNRRDVSRRMRDIAASQAVPAAVRKALVRTQAAINAMVANAG